MPMYGTSYVFSKKFFTGWITVGFIWLSFTAWGVVIFPLWEGRKTMKYTVVAMYLDVTGRKKPKHTLHGEEEVQEASPGAATPDEKVIPKA